MTFSDYTNAELIAFVETKQHYRLTEAQLIRFNKVLGLRLAELRYA